MYRGNPRTYAAERRRFAPKIVKYIAVIKRSQRKPMEIREIAEFGKETRAAIGLRQK
jgi:hypothetical protein